MTVVGIDLGGTKVAAAPLRDGELGPAAIEHTDRSGQAGLLDQLAALVDRVKCDKLEAVGIGVPSVVEFETGKVISSVNVPLVDVAIRRVLGERLGVPVFVDNDATVAALAEAHDEQLRMVAKKSRIFCAGVAQAAARRPRSRPVRRGDARRRQRPAAPLPSTHGTRRVPGLSFPGCAVGVVAMRREPITLPFGSL